TLRVWAEEAASSGDYVLIWRYINVAPTATPPLALAPVMTVRDSVPDGEYRFYTFQGEAGQRVRMRVEAEAGSGFDPVAALLGPDGDLLVEVDDVDSDLNPSFTFQLPQSGSYNVRVNGYLAGGPFTVYVETVFS
ncbi:MAG: PPC domain-containing protein, partial [Phototrophicaceae bacterium]